MKQILTLALTIGVISTAAGQIDTPWQKGAAFATIDLDHLQREDDGQQHFRFPCGASYERIRTHKPGDSPAMWHETAKEGEIKRTRDSITVAGKRYDVAKGILSGRLEFLYNDADWTGLIIHTPKLDYFYIIESENCPYAGIEN